MMTKFSVGDKVRITEGLGEGESGVVIEVDNSNVPYCIETPRGEIWKYADRIVAYEPKHITTDRRLTEAEAKIAALEAEVKALKDASKPKTIVVNSCFAKVSEDADIGRIASALFERLRPTPQTPNQRRADVIKRAQAFVADTIGAYPNFEMTIGRFSNQAVSATFHVNAEKRTVVALVHGYFSRKLVFKAVAKCAPDDVFNADIGKAIALGRALGVKAPKEFTDAVKPTEVVVGMRVNNSYEHAAEFGWGVGKVKMLDGGSGYRVEDGSWSFVRSAIILDDSDAVYL